MLEQLIIVAEKINGVPRKLMHQATMIFVRLNINEFVCIKNRHGAPNFVVSADELNDFI